MNKLNYASLEASKRLVKAGIVLETDFHYCQKSGNYPISLQYDGDSKVNHVFIPAPSMADVWRELPEESYCLLRPSRKTIAGVRVQRPEGLRPLEDDRSISENPTDALIELMIWVRRNQP